MTWAVCYWVHDDACVVAPFLTDFEANAWIEQHVDLDHDEMEQMGLQLVQVLPPDPWPPEADVPIPVPK